MSKSDESRVLAEFLGLATVFLPTISSQGSGFSVHILQKSIYGPYGAYSNNQEHCMQAVEKLSFPGGFQEPGVPSGGIRGTRGARFWGGTAIPSKWLMQRRDMCARSLQHKHMTLRKRKT